MKNGFIALITVLLLSSLSACHTVRGVGEDVESGGQAIQRSTQ